MQQHPYKYNFIDVENNRWKCPKCLHWHVLVNTTSIKPRICYNCKFKVYIRGKLEMTSVNKFRMVIAEMSEFIPKQIGGVKNE